MQVRSADESTEPPPARATRIFVLTPNGRRLADVPELGLWTWTRGDFRRWSPRRSA